MADARSGGVPKAYGPASCIAPYPARTVFEENFDNDEAFRLFCSEVGDERAELAWHGPNHSPDNIFNY